VALLCGIAWTAELVWWYLISGFGLFILMLVGPFALILGTVVAIVGRRPRLGAGTSLVGCSLVVFYAGYGLHELLFGDWATSRLHMSIGFP